MDYWSALEVLGLEDDDELNREQVRRTYMRRLREHPPERDPEGFRLLREAYEAVRYAVPDAPQVAKEEAAKIVVVDAPAAVEPEQKHCARYTVIPEEREHDSGSTYSLTGDRVADEREHDAGSTYSLTGNRIADEREHDAGSTYSLTGERIPVRTNGTTYSLTGDRIPERTNGSTHSRSAYSYKGDELPNDDDERDEDFDAGERGADNEDRDEDFADDERAADDEERGEDFDDDEHAADDERAADDEERGEDFDDEERAADDDEDEDFDDEERAADDESDDDERAADDESDDDERAADDELDDDERAADGDDEDFDDEERAADDDEDFDDEKNDDEDFDDDEDVADEREVDELGRPTMSLSTLVDKLLVLLEHDEVDEALALEREWREHGDTDDHRQTNQYVALKWALTRELLGVAGNLPAPITRALAKGIDASDFALVRPFLEGYRHTNPHQAEDANVVLATRANDIYQQIKGTLYVAPPPRPQYFQQQPPPSVSTSKSGFSAVWIGLVALLIMVRVMAKGDCGSSSSSKLDIDIPNIKIDYKPPTIDYSKLSDFSNRVNEPKPFDPSAERSQLIYEITDALPRFKTYEYDTEQRARVDVLVTYVHAEKCPKIRTTLKKIEDESLDPMPVQTAYLQGIRKRVDVLCPPPKTKAKPKKKKKSDE